MVWTVKLCNCTLWQKRKLARWVIQSFCWAFIFVAWVQTKRRIVTELCISCAYQAFFAISSSTYYMTEISTFENEVSFLQKVSTLSFLQNLQNTFFPCYWMFVIVVLKIGCVLLLSVGLKYLSWKLLVTKVIQVFLIPYLLPYYIILNVIQWFLTLLFS